MIYYHVIEYGYTDAYKRYFTNDVRERLEGAFQLDREFLQSARPCPSWELRPCPSWELPESGNMSFTYSSGGS